MANSISATIQPPKAGSSPRSIATVYRPLRTGRQLAWLMLTGPLVALAFVMLVMTSPLFAQVNGSQLDRGPQPTVRGQNAGQPDGLQPVDGDPFADVEDVDADGGEEAPSFLQTVANLSQTLGIWIVPFGIATVIAIWFTTERLVVLRKGRVIPRPFVNKFLGRLEEGDLEADEALDACEENGSPIANIFAHGVRKWGKPSVEVEQAIIDGGERQVAGLRKHLRVIHGIATVTPLIGLLGTVWGMYEAFNTLAQTGASGRTEDLAQGIALALVTTAAGLLIAIPCLIAYMYLSGRVDSLVMMMDDLAQRVVNSISAEALNETAPVRRVKKKGA